VTRWITSHPGHLTDEETAKLGRVKARSAHLSAAGHVTAFAEMMTGRHGERLPAWISAVGLGDLPSLHSFTCGIRHDQAAVVNGLTLAHSSGAVEGNVCRVKALRCRRAESLHATAIAPESGGRVRVVPPALLPWFWGGAGIGPGSRPDLRVG
jgi:transposase